MKKWPKPNAQGFFDKRKALAYRYETTVLKVEGLILQVGELEWVSAVSIAPKSNDKGTYIAMSDGLRLQPDNHLRTREQALNAMRERIKSVTRANSPGAYGHDWELVNTWAEAVEHQLELF